MKARNNTNTKAEVKAVPHEYEVTRAIQFKPQRGKDTGDVVFDLRIDDITVYGCRVVEGKNGDFISLPREKGRDGNYWSIVYKRFTDEETNAILDMVSARLAAM